MRLAGAQKQLKTDGSCGPSAQGLKTAPIKAIQFGVQTCSGNQHGLEPLKAQAVWVRPHAGQEQGRGLGVLGGAALARAGAAFTAGSALGHTPALACAPNKDVADCLALILSTMKPFPPKDAISSFSFNLLKNCGIAAKTAACGALPNGSTCPYSKDRHNAIGLDGCYSE